MFARGWVACLMLGGLAAVSRLEPGTPADPPERLALLVGIDHYPPGGGFSDLGGAVRDTLALRDVLVRRFGFRDADIVLLHDERATHEAIVCTFAAHLVARAGPRTEAVFFFSGHGSRVPDASEREPDGLDSTYVAYDSRTGELAGSHDLCDDELFSLVAALCAKTSRVTVIADSCHSGGGLRLGPHERARAVEPGRAGLDRDWVRGFWPPEVPLLDDDAPPLSQDRFLHVAACRRDQLAGETEVPGPNGELLWRGRMSLYLVQALEAVRPGATWGTVLARCQQAVTGESASQSVMVDGAIERVLFGDEFVPVEGLRATLLPDRSAVRIELVIPNGLRRGSRLAIHEDGRGLAEVEIMDINPAYARAIWVGAAPEPLPRGELRALETTPPSGAPRLKLRVDSGLAPMAVELPAGLVRRTVEGEKADVELLLDGERVQLRTREGIPLLPTALARDDSRLAARLSEALREEVRWRFLFSLGSEPSTLPMNASFQIPTQEEIAARAASWTNSEKTYAPADLRESGLERAAGGELRVRGAPGDALGPVPIVLLQIQNPHSNPLHVAVLSISEDRGRSVIFFEDGEPTHVIAPRATVSVPCRVVAPRDWPLKRPMRDRYLVLSMERPFDPRVHERRPTVRGEDGPVHSGLPAALRLDPSRAGDRQDSTAPYGVVAVDLLVEGS